MFPLGENAPYAFVVEISSSFEFILPPLPQDLAFVSEFS